ncbi:unnamed protein product [Pleuronectes platessa]|uniref:Uncharacterized protein n=1 Tax=Pleuronectes platessa TaxID=8262 RepID=A0A9N7V3Y0_PLEPL|nr:unnamed protein product [Pleuronectes platessa]
MEEELAKHLKQLADQFHGFAPVKCRELAFEYAEKANIPVPANWNEKQCAAGLSALHRILEEMCASSVLSSGLSHKKVFNYFFSRGGSARQNKHWCQHCRRLPPRA